MTDTRARRLCSARRGILALDTPAVEIARRCRAAGITPTATVLDGYRAMVLRTPELALHVGGVLLHGADLVAPVGDRTAAEFLERAGVTPGVRVDTGHEPGTGMQGRVTSGLDGLAMRLGRFRAGGAHFGLWSVCTTGQPDDLATLVVNSQAAARFALLCQDHDLVPVLRIGSRVSAGSPTARRVALGAAVLSVLGHLEDLDVDLGRVVVNAVAADDADDLDPRWGSPLEVLPSRLGGVVLTAGMEGRDVDDDTVADRLRRIAGPAHWPVTFLVGREATTPALQAWRGVPSRAGSGQDALTAALKRVAARLPARVPW